jgi:4'-phosphopantetheinyl transferase
VTRGREVGVDLEYIRREPNLLEGVEQFFAPREIAKLRALPASLRYEAFFACWTRKEAYLKARGDGLSIPLDQFEVSLAPTEPAALLHTQWDAQEAQRWSLRELTPGPGYVAALAVEGQTPAEGGVWRLKCWQWAD